MNVGYWLTAGLAMTLIAFSKAGFGGGPGVLAAPLMSTVCDPTTAIAVMLPIMMVCDVWCVTVYRRGCVWSLVWRLLGGFIIGVGVATFLLVEVSGQEVWLKKVIGALSILFGLSYFLFLKDKKRMERTIPQGSWFGLAMGVFAGISSTLAHAAGPPVAMYLMSQAKGQSKDNFMGTIIMFAFFGNLIKVPSYLLSGAMTRETLAITWPLLAAIPFGLWLGWLLNRRLSYTNFQVWINLLLVIIGVFLVLT